MSNKILRTSRRVSHIQLLLSQPYPMNQVSEAWIGSERIELRLNVHPENLPRALLIAFFHPGKGLILIAKSNVNKSDQDWVDVFTGPSLAQFRDGFLGLGAFA